MRKIGFFHRNRRHAIERLWGGLCHQIQWRLLHLIVIRQSRWRHRGYIDRCLRFAIRMLVRWNLLRWWRHHVWLLRMGVEWIHSVASQWTDLCLRWNRFAAFLRYNVSRMFGCLRFVFEHAYCAEQKRINRWKRRLEIIANLPLISVSATGVESSEISL